MENRPPLKTVDTALSILLMFTEKNPEWGVTELSDETGLPTSNTQRILATLAGRGFLRMDPRSHRYRLGPAMWHISSLWERTAGLDELTRPELEGLSRITGRTALFSIPDGVHVRVVSIVDGKYGPAEPHGIRNALYPAHAGAAPRAYFSFLDDDTRKSLLLERPFGQYSETTIKNWDEFNSKVAETRELGYAISVGEFNPNTRALGLPVMVAGQPLASLSLLEDSKLCDTPIQDCLDDLKRAATTVGMKLTEKISSTRISRRDQS